MIKEMILLQVFGNLSANTNELLSNISWLIQAIGGIVVIYLILIIVRIYLMKREFKMIEEMKKDIKTIKRKLNKTK